VTTEANSDQQGSYALFGNLGEQQARRLKSISAVWDEGTVRVLRSIGIGPSWRCWEVGAGEGSVARTMAEIVGESGRVVASDIDPNLLEESAGSNLEVLQHDVVGEDPPPGGPFDVVHARMVLQHLPGRDEAFRRMAGAVAPGGWLVLEDSDWSTLLAARPPLRELELLRDGLAAVMSGKGFDTACGVSNVRRLLDAGFEDVRGEGRTSVMRGGSPGVAWYHEWAGRLREAMVAAGHLTDEEFERTDSLLDDPNAMWLSQTLIAACGRKPQSVPAR
jgi:SAM-dependent methyltransferase